MQFINTTSIISRILIFLDLSFASHSKKNTMFQELDQFLFSGNIEEAPTQYGLTAWAEKLCAGF